MINDFSGHKGAAIVTGGSGGIGAAVCFLASHRARFITGQKLDVDGGYGA